MAAAGPRLREEVGEVVVQVWQEAAVVGVGLGQGLSVQHGDWKLAAVPLHHVTGCIAGGKALRSAVVGSHRAETLAFAGSGVFAEKRCSSGASLLVATPELGKEALDAVVTAQVLCEQISRVDFAADLEELNGAVPDPLLNPKALRIDVAELA